MQLHVKSAFQEFSTGAARKRRSKLLQHSTELLHHNEYESRVDGALTA